MPDDASTSDSVQAELHAELGRLRDENHRLALLSRQLTASAALQGMRAGAQSTQAYMLRRQVEIMQSSKFWQLTWPLRLAIDLARGAPDDASSDAARVRRFFTTMRRQGLGSALRNARQFWARGHPARRPSVSGLRVNAETSSGATLPLPSRVLAPSVLIIAELTLPQCAKYRVWQKQEHFARLGVACRVVDWRFTEDCLSAASLATQAILYRVPAYKQVLRLIARLHELRVPTAWEVDDLIFDRALYLQNRNIDDLDPELREGILSGVELYRNAMLACGAGIASTPVLAQAMRDAGLARVDVVENALDNETLSLARSLRQQRELRVRRTDDVLITYGSGTKTHDADFREAAPALLSLLKQCPNTRLRIVGELNLPEGFSDFGERVQNLPPAPYARYLQLLAESDISIAPLEATVFNDAKSNIKYLEAAILGMPSICSPCANFISIVRDGENGFLAASEQAWQAGLLALVRDASLRRRMGEAALHAALARYDPAAIARSQVAPLLLRAPDERASGRLRVVLANIYFAPRSYGGATLVVEEMARRLHARGDTEITVITGLSSDSEDRVTTRTDQDGITVFALPVSDGDVVGEFDDAGVGAAFLQVLDAVQPHVVHLHAVQWLSASVALACAERRIPYVITLHDAWWLCARQFMVREDGTYCFQKTIDLHVCQNCMPGARHLEPRAALLRAAMDGAALLLSPSEAHRQLYLANGIAPGKIKLAPNGVRLPSADRRPRRPGATLRFAFVGGNVEVKGFSIVKRAFEALLRGDWTLVLVDNTLNLGFSSVVASDWSVKGELRIVPAYTQDDMEKFFDEIDVLLFPSQWKESFGLTVREALARDVWVIATDGGGPAEAIVDGVNGTLIPLDGRHDGLQHAVETLLSDPGRLAGFVNPYAGEIGDYATQAAALHDTLTRVARLAREEQCAN